MARNTKCKRTPRRCVLKPLLIAGEGATEKAFCLHLMKLFYPGRNCGFNVQVKTMRGGDPASVLNKTKRYLAGKSYAGCVVIMDRDLPWPSKIPDKLGKTPLKCIGLTPCVETLLLKILRLTAPNDTARAKREFHKLIPSKAATNYLSYQKLFTRELLNKQRKSISELNALLKVIETGNLD